MSAPTRSRQPSRPTLDEIRSWPSTVRVEEAAAALGCSRAHAYKSIKIGTFPARTLKVGNKRVVITASILESLGAQA